jgi:hypothetical protein
VQHPLKKLTIKFRILIEHERSSGHFLERSRVPFFFVVGFAGRGRFSSLLLPVVVPPSPFRAMEFFVPPWYVPVEVRFSSNH